MFGKKQWVGRRCQAGPVEAPLRKKGLDLGRLQKFFNHYTTEWLWIDVLAMPKERTEEVRVHIINRLRGVYERADQVIVLGSLLLRLYTGSMIDVAVIRALSSRLWCFTKSWLARCGVLKAEDAAFDLDELLNLLQGCQ